MTRLSASGATQTEALEALVRSARQRDREIDVSSISVDRTLDAGGQVVRFYLDADTYPDEP